MQDIHINLIVQDQANRQWHSLGEFKLPVLPRVGEHIVPANETKVVYKVSGVLHTVPFQGLTEVWAVQVSTLHEFQDSLSAW